MQNTFNDLRILLGFFGFLPFSPSRDVHHHFVLSRIFRGKHHEPSGVLVPLDSEWVHGGVVSQRGFHAEGLPFTRDWRERDEHVAEPRPPRRTRSPV